MAEGTTVVIAEPVAAGNEPGNVEVGEPGAGEVAEAAVEIAEIQAERDVEIAETEAEASVEIAEAIAEVSAVEQRLGSIEAWQEAHGPADHPAIQSEIAGLREAMLLTSTTLAEALTRLEALEQPNQGEPPAEGGDGNGAEPGPPSSEPPPAAEPSPEPEAPPAVPPRRVRWV